MPDVSSDAKLLPREFSLADLPNRRLDSWKEIADFFDREVRTVIRWEKDRGLPIHRVPGAKRSAVFAFVQELETWKSGQVESLGDATPFE